MLRAQCRVALSAHTKELDTTWSHYLTDVTCSSDRDRKKKMLFLAYSLAHPLQLELKRDGKVNCALPRELAAVASYMIRQRRAISVHICLAAYVEIVSGVALQEHLGWGSNSFGKSTGVTVWAGYRMVGDEDILSPRQRTVVHSLSCCRQVFCLPSRLPHHILHAFWVCSLVLVW